MWTVGHSSIGYLLSRPAFGKAELQPRTILVIFFMSSLLDFAHIHEARTLTHSLLVFVLVTGSAIFILYRLQIIGSSERFPLVIAAGSHIIADILFGSFAPAIPFSYFEITIFGWGSYFDYIVEASLFTGMLVSMYLTGDLDRFINKPIIRSKIRPRELFQDLFISGLILIIMAQIGAVFYLDFLNGYNFYNEAIYNDGSLWYISLIFMAVQAVFAYVLFRFVIDRYFKDRSVKPG